VGKSFLKSWSSLSCSRNFPPVTEPEVLLQCSQEPATGTYVEAHESSPLPHTSLT
jgi:hypothetical protein